MKTTLKDFIKNFLDIYCRKFCTNVFDEILPREISDPILKVNPTNQIARIQGSIIPYRSIINFINVSRVYYSLQVNYSLQVYYYLFPNLNYGPIITFRSIIIYFQI